MNLVSKTDTVTVNNDVFASNSALAASHGQTLKPYYNKDVPVTGASGNTQAFVTKNSGAVYLTEADFTVNAA